VEIDPGLLSARVNWAMALSGQGKHERAIEHYRKALEIKPDNAVVLGILPRTPEALASGGR